MRKIDVKRLWKVAGLEIIIAVGNAGAAAWGVYHTGAHLMSLHSAWDYAAVVMAGTLAVANAATAVLVAAAVRRRFDILSGMNARNSY